MKKQDSRKQTIKKVTDRIAKQGTPAYIMPQNVVMVLLLEEISEKLDLLIEAPKQKSTVEVKSTVNETREERPKSFLQKLFSSEKTNK